MKTSVVILTFLALKSSSALNNMGPCSVTVSPDTSMDFNDFASENDGLWCEYMVPKTSFNADLQSLSYHLNPRPNENKYELAMFYVKSDGEMGIFTNEVMTDTGNGAASSLGSDYTLNITFLSYVPGRYAYYYLCSDKGTDRSADYRYVLTHGELSDGEKQDIRNIDNSYGFNGDLIELPKLC